MTKAKRRAYKRGWYVNYSTLLAGHNSGLTITKGNGTCGCCSKPIKVNGLTITRLCACHTKRRCYVCSRCQGHCRCRA